VLQPCLFSAWVDLCVTSCSLPMDQLSLGQP
jgi:hypothetical protein